MKTKEKLKIILEKENFSPGWLGYLVNPFFLARRELGRAVKGMSSYIKGRILDVGCGTKPYQSFFTYDEYIGMEIDSPEAIKQGTADIFYDGKTFPFQEESFDSVVINQVLEHVFNPDQFLKEVHRILKVDGKALITVPFVWDEHEQPYDYARYSSFGLKSLFEKHGFKVIEQKKTLADFRIFGQLINAWFFKKINTRVRILDFILRIIFTVFFNTISYILYFVLPGNNDFYLDNVILVAKDG
ncbi:MAG: class I SAM-dependent methyltransferase [Lentisphaerae bacterium]|nr:class I SAM-dependent methyltransferase [Lentisphaerota bacterium]MCP4100702.1 class I SAM-dependent methyltransferase [Lentisphaerota bacterium]